MPFEGVFDLARRGVEMLAEQTVAEERDGAGTLTEWLGQADGSFAWNPGAVYQVSASWKIETTGDFNRDGFDDILWRDGNGTLSQWLGGGSGASSWNPAAIYQTPTSWHVQPDTIA